MGYTISTLNSLPNHFDYYFFMIGNYLINDRISNFFRCNFNDIAEEIGKKSAIVKDSGRKIFEKELIQSLSLVKNPKIKQLIHDFEYHDPGLLILDSHPGDINDETLIIYIPVRNLDKIYNTNLELYRDLINLSEKRNTVLVKKIQSQGKTWRKTLSKIDLKPNVWGIGININKLLGAE